MLARCAGEKRAAVIDGLLASYEAWGFDDTPANLLKAVQSLGMTPEGAERCLTDKALAGARSRKRERRPR